MREANRSYEANLQVIKQARDMITMTIDLMRSTRDDRRHRTFRPFDLRPQLRTRPSSARIRPPGAAASRPPRPISAMLTQMAADAVERVKTGEATADRRHPRAAPRCSRSSKP